MLDRATTILIGAWFVAALGLVANISMSAQFAQNTCQVGKVETSLPAQSDRC